MRHDGLQFSSTCRDSFWSVIRISDLKRERFDDLVKQHGGLVFSIAYHFLGSAALAEEISQDVFLELHKNMGKIDSDVHALAWLRRSTTNRCIDASRKSSYRREVPIHDTFHPASAGVMSDPMLQEGLRKAVGTLPEWQRAVVILRYQEDMDPEEIAAVLEIPVNTVKSRLHRAIEALREKFDRKKVVQ